MDELQTTEQVKTAVQMLFSVMQPEMIAEVEKLRNAENRLVHYTSAENAMNIIKSQTFWLRNVRCMNDYSEVQHGIQMLLKVFGENENARRERLVRALDQVVDGAARAAIAEFDQWIPTLPDTTFIGCLSQWDNDDQHGRLSMWRAYTATGAGVALILNSDPFLAETDALQAYSLPVAYLPEEGVAGGIDRCLSAIEANLSSLSVLNFDTIKNTVFWWLLTMAVSLKHPAFSEEREWRIIYLPNMWRSDIIEECVETIQGIPQVVQKIPLKDEPGNGLIKADISNLIHKIIIGPSEFPLVLFDAFSNELKRKGVEVPNDRIGVSFIPLRNRG